MIQDPSKIMCWHPKLIPRSRVIPDLGNRDSYYAFHGNISQVASYYSPESKLEHH